LNPAFSADGLHPSAALSLKYIMYFHRNFLELHIGFSTPISNV
jgi:hypothetical protein